MGFSINKESYAGSIKEISIGKGEKAVTVGGETSYPFYFFEGDMPNKPKVAMEIWDIKPDEWPESVLCHFKDVVSDVATWAKKCVDEYGAEAIVLQLKSIDPNGENASPEQAAETVKKVLAVIDVPLIIWGCANPEKQSNRPHHNPNFNIDESVLTKGVELYVKTALNYFNKSISSCSTKKIDKNYRR